MIHKNIYILSDAVGESARLMAQAVLAQFQSELKPQIKRYPFIQETQDLLPILGDAKREDAFLAATFVNQGLDLCARAYAQEHGLAYVNFMQEMIDQVSQSTQLAPSQEIGAQRRVNQDYFNRMAAMEYAIKHDDGKSSQKSLLDADIILLGVSRSGKTPLSMYLANHSWKVANFPLLPEVRLPEILDQIAPRKLFGLIASPRYILNVRTHRLKDLGLTGEAPYSQLDRIKRELQHARTIYQELGVQEISIEYKSIEESGSEIENLLQNPYPQSR
ncbi:MULTISPECIES: pyruvate, water dikinase regulatory protein [Aerococcus]|uniref:Putative pyruvate, phosphate dikinase regulatory protein n=2 Tax=Lactobacillales TaxID=186826 RepID=A0A5N1GP22_9LACT|nr:MULTISPECIES: pyruvate, water dikinase regulatory protein [Aerococcus]KAA9302154.1 kinase/pyrophosphorylase [Aerococcus sanguinicola]MDK6368415.1 pyruvate, water dikinase regulatory protein [Aerococcus sp. UMB9870]MDK6679498.1 pyruvate, water dikinase regulatory protein [Aerococcus sp. UMB8608]MDK6686342.1 pyruvate, water dikinase regulatory protein [Aerococcus sp. UMB8623]MDK6941036.1 pyruvate, water dikinase regulatory protein [Aerococcus sp. UMB8487]